MRWPNVPDEYLELFFMLKALMLTVTGGEQFYVEIDYDRHLIKSSGQGIFKYTDEEAFVIFETYKSNMPAYLQNLKIETTTIEQITTGFEQMVESGEYTPDRGRALVDLIQATVKDTELRYNFRGCFFLIYKDIENFRTKLTTANVITPSQYIHPYWYVLIRMFGITQATLDTITEQGLYPETDDWMTLTGNKLIENLKKQDLYEPWNADFIISFLIMWSKVIRKLEKS